MKNPNIMSNKQLINWLNKTAKSMAKAWKSSNYRKIDLVDRFEELSNEAKIRKVWTIWCDDNNCSKDADGWDFFA